MPQSHEHLCKPPTVSGRVQLVILTQRHLNGLLWEYNLVSCILFFWVVQMNCPHSVCSTEISFMWTWKESDYEKVNSNHGIKQHNSISETHPCFTATSGQHSRHLLHVLLCYSLIPKRIKVMFYIEMLHTSPHNNKMKNICLKFLQIYQNNLQPFVAWLPLSLLTVLSIFTAPQSKKGKNAYFLKKNKFPRITSKLLSLCHYEVLCLAF